MKKYQIITLLILAIASIYGLIIGEIGKQDILIGIAFLMILLITGLWQTQQYYETIEKNESTQYSLTIEELKEIGHCVLADSIRDGDNYDVDDTIIKWLTQYKQYKPYFTSQR